MKQVNSRARMGAGGQRRAVWNIMELEENGELDKLCCFVYLLHFLIYYVFLVPVPL